MRTGFKVLLWIGANGETRKVSGPMRERDAMALYRDIAALAMGRNSTGRVGGVAIINPAGDATHSVRFS